MNGWGPKSSNEGGIFIEQPLARTVRPPDLEPEIAGNGCANFVSAWHFWFILQEMLHAHKMVFWVLSGKEVPNLLLWAWSFFFF